MTSTELSALAGVVLSLLVSYLPGLREKFAAQTPTTKSLVMAILLVLVAAGALFYKCNLGLECVTANWHDYAIALFAALVANQATYTISPQASSVKLAKTGAFAVANAPKTEPVVETPKEATK